MYFFTKPTGGLIRGKALLKRPNVTRLDAGVPARLAFVTDLHIRENGLSMIDTVAEMLEDLAPQLILLGGDYGEGRGCALRFFARLKDVLPGVPKLAVLGNNDDCFFEDDRGALLDAMRECGVTPLDNEMARLTVNGHAFEIAGVTDCYHFTPCAENLFSDAPDTYRILLSHAPHSFLLEQCAPDLMLSGHTHGGQVNVLGLTCYTLLRYEKWLRFTHLSGVKKVGNTLCVVSNGIGISKFAVRLGAQPEIHLFAPQGAERRQDQ